MAAGSTWTRRIGGTVLLSKRVKLGHLDSVVDLHISSLVHFFLQRRSFISTPLWFVFNFVYWILVQDTVTSSSLLSVLFVLANATAACHGGRCTAGALIKVRPLAESIARPINGHVSSTLCPRFVHVSFRESVLSDTYRGLLARWQWKSEISSRPSYGYRASFGHGGGSRTWPLPSAKRIERAGV